MKKHTKVTSIGKNAIADLYLLLDNAKQNIKLSQLAIDEIEMILGERNVTVSPRIDELRFGENPF